MRGYDTAADGDLLQWVAAGDEAALRTLVERHAGWLQLRLQRRCADPEVVADALQDTFVAVWRSARSYRGEGDVGAWLWGIAVRRLVSRLRGRPVPEAVTEDELGSHLPPSVSAEEQLLVAVEHGDVGSALRALSPELRRVVQATVIDGLSSREAALLLGIPTGTVKSRVRAAKSQLRDHLAAAPGGGRLDDLGGGFPGVHQGGDR